MVSLTVRLDGPLEVRSASRNVLSVFTNDRIVQRTRFEVANFDSENAPYFHLEPCGRKASARAGCCYCAIGTTGEVLGYKCSFDRRDFRDYPTILYPLRLYPPFGPQCLAKHFSFILHTHMLCIAIMSYYLRWIGCKSDLCWETNVLCPPGTRVGECQRRLCSAVVAQPPGSRDA